MEGKEGNFANYGPSAMNMGAQFPGAPPEECPSRGPPPSTLRPHPQGALRHPTCPLPLPSTPLCCGRRRCFSASQGESFLTCTCNFQLLLSPLPDFPGSLVDYNLHTLRYSCQGSGGAKAKAKGKGKGVVFELGWGESAWPPKRSCRAWQRWEARRGCSRFQALQGCVSVGMEGLQVRLLPVERRRLEVCTSVLWLRCVIVAF